MAEQVLAVVLELALEVAPAVQVAAQPVHRAIEGGQQTLSNLAAYVTEIVRKGAEG